MNKMPGKERGASDTIAELRAKEKSEPIASFLRMELRELSPGYARVVMKLTPVRIELKPRTNRATIVKTANTLKLFVFITISSFFVHCLSRAAFPFPCM